MFTGLIEHLGRVEAVRPAAGGASLRVDLGPLVEGCAIGDSIAVNGSCLTVSTIDGDIADFEVSAESLTKTTMGAWRPGRAVNLERALPAGGRLGGHLVAGHVDGVGRLQDRRPRGNSVVYTFLLPDDGSVMVVEKGSVAVDGISLTSYDCRGRRFSVAVIPHTAEHTTLPALRRGERVNLEQDVISRWVERLMPGG